MSLAPADTLPDQAAAAVPITPDSGPATVQPPQAVESTPSVPSKPPVAPIPTPEPSTDSRAAIQALLADYARAINSKNLAELRRIYPGMTQPQQQGWEQFFQLVRDVRAELTAQRLDISDNAAEAQITGTYLYLNTSTGRQERQPVSFKASFKKQSGGWRITQVR